MIFHFLMKGIPAAAGFVRFRYKRNMFKSPLVLRLSVNFPSFHWSNIWLKQD
eukprot:10149.XXX_208160_208315_1 [CDS] Oithona nana genome sequencing.